MLTIDLTYRFIYERGMKPPVVDSYETEELEKIVREMSELYDKLDRLEERIHEMYHQSKIGE